MALNDASIKHMGLNFIRDILNKHMEWFGDLQDETGYILLRFGDFMVKWENCHVDY